ncbi:MAG: SufE family protein [Phycisphaerales bacterium]|nr:SufE family protein [Phycisphaerales bacterium]
MSKLEDIISTFRAFEGEMRLQVLLDYANRLPKPPPELMATIGKNDAARVHECMTPVWLWVVPGSEGGKTVKLFVHVGEEAPTVRGVLSVIVHAYEGATADEIAAMPEDLIERLGLSPVLRMNRVIGLHAMIKRIKREASAARAGASPTNPEAGR